MFFFRGDFSWEGGGIRSYPVKENPISSSVSEILQYKHIYKQTDKHPVTLLQGYLDNTFGTVSVNMHVNTISKINNFKIFFLICKSKKTVLI